ncbi:hypothetical protein O181_049258 [Austropuccinia psidii MF-1]|uniref:Uncharacterized protein n=1 Tax=Austropuccinia psidii MF-1 TaxID=1389203 RepID=A0A9Q3HL84_9BASI|nr:hypothetical protein [Austropuccinia psidii MF-1]
MGFKLQSKFSFSSLTHFTSCNHTEFFPLCIGKNQPNPPQQDSPVPSLPHEQTSQQLTPGPSGTQWSEDLFGSPSSEPHEHIPTHEPEPEVAPTQSMEEPVGKSQLHFFYSSQLFLTFPLNISRSSNSTPLRHHHRQYACQIPPLLSPSTTPPPSPRVPPPSQCPQEPHFLIPTMRLARNLLNYDRP